MVGSIDVEAPSFFEDPGKARCRLSPWCSWLLGIAITTLIIMNGVLLKSIDKLKREYGTYGDSLTQVGDRLEEIEPFYRWPLPTKDMLHYECLYASGGGTVGLTGDFPQARLHKTTDCKSVFDWYFSPGSGQYWADLKNIGESALEYLTTKQTFRKDHPSNMVIFDIDETVLSNLRDLQSTAYGSKPANHTLQGDTSDKARMAPALLAMKNVYLSVYEYGMSVAFITGRDEESRDFTEKNLEEEGFGVKCVQDGKGNVKRTPGPCYVALHMRNLNSDRSKQASVYKPERRKQLQDAGYKLVATFGDQFSDLEGPFPAVASFKIPNPMYYIL